VRIPRAILASLILALAALSMADSPPSALAGGPVLAIDADISDGACVDIDDTLTVAFAIGVQVQYAFCLTGNAGDPVAFVQVYAPSDHPSCCEAGEFPIDNHNPDLNAGATTFTSPSYPDDLGEGWVCTHVSNSCSSASGPHTLRNGPLAIASLTVGFGSTEIWIDAVLRSADGSEIGSCTYGAPVSMTCLSAHIHAVPPELAIDANINDGACTDIDSVGYVPPGEETAVALCLAYDHGVPLAGISFRVLYDDKIAYAPEVENAGTALDDNPDFNAGTTTFSIPDLGGGWDCSGGVEAFPLGDENETPGDGVGIAYSGGCASVTGPNMLSSGPLALIEFVGLEEGSTTLQLSQVLLTDDSPAEMGSCSPVVDLALVCSDAELRVGAWPGVCPGSPSTEADSDQQVANGLNLLNGDATSSGGVPDLLANPCDPNDDNDAYLDSDEGVYPVAGCPSATAAISPYKMDTDGDHLSDKWECDNGSDPASSSSKFFGFGGADTDGDRVPDLWEYRGYDASGSSTDSDGDGCHDLVETASVDGNTAVTDADRIAVARRALGIWGPQPEQDYVLDLNRNGAVEDADRIFVARAALLPVWQPKICP
jgi:hypothetical protein